MMEEGQRSSVAERYICIHCHFYQPPRENPWLESVEIQDSAYPFHDWNERITSECYAPNLASRTVNGYGRITDIVSNYSRISFNFGPTLLAWMSTFAPAVYEGILEADRLSVSQRSGHGNALAQVYNHIIMPLANARDKRTQVIWGIRDFRKRFGREPEGMWLAETAVDLETLEHLAGGGILFTILAPHQAMKVRKIGSGKWKDVTEGRIDPTRPYVVRLPSGRRITVFFYDGPISNAIAFERLLKSGEDLAMRLVSGFRADRNWTQLMHVATDGETYGHHHRFGDMALAFALHHVEKKRLARLTNYGEFLERFPPTHEVKIHENTSWSCAHGIERWRSDCGCNSGGHGGWNQAWRRPLRKALDWLRDELARAYMENAGRYLRDPWAARNDYIDVILDRSVETVDDFFAKHGRRVLAADERTLVLKLLESQRHALLMYTSCGWFFDEISGIETVQIIQYAGRAIQLISEISGDDREKTFRSLLEKAKSNMPEQGDGGRIFDRFVTPAVIDLKKVAMHYAVSSVIEDFGDRTEIYSFTVDKEDYFRIAAGRTTLAVGRVLVASRITGDSERISFALLHLGGHAFNGGAREYLGEEGFQSMRTEITAAFERADFAEVFRLMDHHFGMHNYSFTSLFRDRQHAVMNLLLKDTYDKYELVYRDLFEGERILMSFFREAGMAVPNVFRAAAEFILNLDLRKAFSQEILDGNNIRGLVKEIEKWGLGYDTVQIETIIRNRLKEQMLLLQANPSDIALIDAVKASTELSRLLPVEVNLWEVQNIYYSMARSVYQDIAREASGNRLEAVEWVKAFVELGEKLGFDTGSIPGR